MASFSLSLALSLALLACQDKSSARDTAGTHATADDSASESVPVEDPVADYTTLHGSEMIALVAGSFTMGDDDGFSNEQPAHATRLSHAVWMGRSELTQSAWARWTGAPNAAPSAHVGCDDCPVEVVSWDEAARYANALSAEEGLAPCYEADGADVTVELRADPYDCAGYRLPTEAEWEYAARAGEDLTYSGSDELDAVGWTRSNSGGATHAVCTADPDGNAWGLCDLSGNVLEWTNDRYGESYYAEAPPEDPPGPASGALRVYRGGYWDSEAVYARVTNRGSYDPAGRDGALGFRLVRSVVP